MPTPLPVTFTASPLPADFDGTPQQLMDAIVARLAIESQESLTLIGQGTPLPTSDQGPFLFNGTTWYVWDVGTGAYVPATIEFKADLNPKPWRGDSSGLQQIVFAAPGSDSIDLDLTETFDPSSPGVFDSSTFTAQEDGFYHIDAKTAIAATAGTPTDNIVLFYLKKNGFQMPNETVFTELGNVYAGRTYAINTNLQLQAGDTIRMTVGIEIGGGTATWSIAPNDTFMSGYKICNLVF